MAKVFVRTIDNRARTAAEVKRLLQEIAFVLRASRVDPVVALRAE